jgi:diadenosine tetraphosphatase ApaH/serine/threonine PP2A family protein phosphatase
MKLALLSDLHANRRALEACLGHARAAGAGQLVFLGDLVGYVAEPVEVLEAVASLAREGAVVVRGNHDEAALRPPARIDNLEQQSAAWTQARLNDAHRDFIAKLPLTSVIADALVVHASAYEPERWDYADNAVRVERCLRAAVESHGMRRVFCGHVHEQALHYRGRTGSPMTFSPAANVPVPVAGHREWLAVVGSVGQPRDGDPRAMYAMFDVAQSSLVFHRIPYDHLGAAAAIRRAGLPEAFATRLEQGR